MYQLLFVVLGGGFDMIVLWFFFFQAEDGIRDLVRSRGLGDVYKRQKHHWPLRSARRLGGGSRHARRYCFNVNRSVDLEFLSLIHI